MHFTLLNGMLLGMLISDEPRIVLIISAECRWKQNMTRAEVYISDQY